MHAGSTVAEAQAPRPVGLLHADRLVVAQLGPDDAVVKAGVAELRVRAAGTSALLTRIVELADGTRDASGIVAELGEDERDTATALVAALHRRGLLTDSVTEASDQLFWRSVSTFATDPAATLAAASVVVSGDPELTGPIAEALRDCGVGQVTDPDDPVAADAELRCVAVVGSPHGALLEAAEQALEQKATFLPVWLEDLVGHVGPLTFPRQSACLRCYLTRADSNDDNLEAHRALRGHGPARPAGHLPPMAAVLAQVAALEVVKQLTGLPSTVIGHVVDVEFVPFGARARRVLTAPRCPSCSAVARRGTPVVSTTPSLRE